MIVNWHLTVHRVNDTEYPTRIKFDVSNWVELKKPAKFGMPKWILRGVCNPKDEFFEHRKNQAIIDKLQ